MGGGVIRQSTSDRNTTKPEQESRDSDHLPGCKSSGNVLEYVKKWVLNPQVGALQRLQAVAP